MPYRPTLPSRANAKARAAVGKARKRPTLPAKASPKAVAAVVRPKASMRKGYGRKR